MKARKPRRPLKPLALVHLEAQLEIANKRVRSRR